MVGVQRMILLLLSQLVSQVKAAHSDVFSLALYSPSVLFELVRHQVFRITLGCLDINLEGRNLYEFVKLCFV